MLTLQVQNNQSFPPEAELVVEVFRVGLGGLGSLDILQSSHLLAVLKICSWSDNSDQWRKNSYERDFTCSQKPSLAPATLLVPREQPKYGLVWKNQTLVTSIESWTWWCEDFPLCRTICVFCLCVEADGISKAWPRKHCVSCIPVPGLNSEHLIQNIVRKKGLSHWYQKPIK